jgi:nucleotide-binding universal stress UspA family protein
MLDTRLLLALDGSDASRRAVKYVAKFVARRKGFRICLVHVLGPLPPELLEHGGSEDPSKEAQLERELKVEQGRWIATAKKTAPKDLDQAAAMLRKGGSFRQSTTNSVL